MRGGAFWRKISSKGSSSQTIFCNLIGQCVASITWIWRCEQHPNLAEKSDSGTHLLSQQSDKSALCVHTVLAVPALDVAQAHISVQRFKSGRRKLSRHGEELQSRRGEACERCMVETRTLERYPCL